MFWFCVAIVGLIAVIAFVAWLLSVIIPYIVLGLVCGVAIIGIAVEDWLKGIAARRVRNGGD